MYKKMAYLKVKQKCLNYHNKYIGLKQGEKFKYNFHTKFLIQIKITFYILQNHHIVESSCLNAECYFLIFFSFIN